MFRVSGRQKLIRYITASIINIMIDNSLILYPSRRDTRLSIIIILGLSVLAMIFSLGNAIYSSILHLYGLNQTSPFSSLCSGDTYFNLKYVTNYSYIYFAAYIGVWIAVGSTIALIACCAYLLRKYWNTEEEPDYQMKQGYVAAAYILCSVAALGIAVNDGYFIATLVQAQMHCLNTFSVPYFILLGLSSLSLAALLLEWVYLIILSRRYQNDHNYQKYEKQVSQQIQPIQKKQTRHEQTLAPINEPSYRKQQNNEEQIRRRFQQEIDNYARLLKEKQQVSPEKQLKNQNKSPLLNKATPTKYAIVEPRKEKLQPISFEEFKKQQALQQQKDTSQAYQTTPNASLFNKKGGIQKSTNPNNSNYINPMKNQNQQNINTQNNVNNANIPTNSNFKTNENANSPRKNEPQHFSKQSKLENAKRKNSQNPKNENTQQFQNSFNSPNNKTHLKNSTASPSDSKQKVNAFYPEEFRKNKNELNSSNAKQNSLQNAPYLNAPIHQISSPSNTNKNANLQKNQLINSQELKKQPTQQNIQNDQKYQNSGHQNIQPLQKNPNSLESISSTNLNQNLNNRQNQNEERDPNFELLQMSRKMPQKNQNIFHQVGNQEVNAENDNFNENQAYASTPMSDHSPIKNERIVKNQSPIKTKYPPQFRKQSAPNQIQNSLKRNQTSPNRKKSDSIISNRNQMNPHKNQNMYPFNNQNSSKIESIPNKTKNFNKQNEPNSLKKQNKSKENVQNQVQNQNSQDLNASRASLSKQRPKRISKSKIQQKDDRIDYHDYLAKSKKEIFPQGDQLNNSQLDRFNASRIDYNRDQTTRRMLEDQESPWAHLKRPVRLPNQKSIKNETPPATERPSLKKFQNPMLKQQSSVQIKDYESPKFSTNKNTVSQYISTINKSPKSSKKQTNGLYFHKRVNPNIKPSKSRKKLFEEESSYLAQNSYSSVLHQVDEGRIPRQRDFRDSRIYNRNNEGTGTQIKKGDKLIDFIRSKYVV